MYACVYMISLEEKKIVETLYSKGRIEEKDILFFWHWVQSLIHIWMTFAFNCLPTYLFDGLYLKIHKLLYVRTCLSQILLAHGNGQIMTDCSSLKLKEDWPYKYLYNIFINIYLYSFFSTKISSTRVYVALLNKLI